MLFAFHIVKILQRFGRVQLPASPLLFEVFLVGAKGTGNKNEIGYLFCNILIPNIVCIHAMQMVTFNHFILCACGRTWSS